MNPAFLVVGAPSSFTSRASHFFGSAPLRARPRSVLRRRRCFIHADALPHDAQAALPERATSTPNPPPPGREDEFADVNGDSLEEKQSSSVATLDPERSFDTVLQELTAIQQDGPRNVAILGTRYTSFLHQQIIELLTYANVLLGNHVFTSGAGGTNAAVIRGALRAEKPELLTVVLPQSLYKQPRETQEQVSPGERIIRKALCRSEMRRHRTAH